MTMTFADAPGGTRLTWRMVFTDARTCERIRPIAAPGNEQNFDRLAALLTDALGQVGLGMAAGLAANVILMDIMMSGEDGITLTREIRSDPATVTLPFIFLTANTEKRHIVTGIEAGADEYVMKPFDRETLQSKLQIVGLA